MYTHMKRLFALSLLLFVSTVFVAANSGPPGDFKNYSIEQSLQVASDQGEAYAFVMPGYQELAFIETGLINPLVVPARIDATAEKVTSITLPPARAVDIRLQTANTEDGSYSNYLTCLDNYCIDKTLNQYVLNQVTVLPMPFT